MKAFVISLLLIIMAGLLGCEENGPPPDTIDEETYVNLLVELQLFRAYLESTPVDSTKLDSLRREIFAKYNVSAESCRESHDYYQEQYIEQKERINKAMEKLRMDQVQSDSAKASRSN